MTDGDVGRRQPERTGFQLAFLHVLLQEGEQVFVLIVFICADVNDETALVGYDIMLCTAIQHRNGHLRGT